MSRPKICIHNLDDPALQLLNDFDVVGNTRTREDLRTLIGMENVSVVIINLDDDDALDIVVEILEIKRGIPIVGVTGSQDVQKCIMAQRAGCRQLAGKPIHAEDLRVAIRRAVNHGDELKNPLGKPIAVMSAVGGAGSTTFSCYLAMGLADIAHTTVGIVDFDLEFGAVARAWDVQPKCTLGDVIIADRIDKLLLDDAFIELPGGVAVLPRPESIEHAHAVTDKHATKIIDTARHQYPYLVMDLPRRLDAVTGAAIQICKKLIIVLELTANGIYNASRLSDTLIKYGLSADTIEFVVNRYRKGVHHVTVESLESKVGKRVLGVVPNNYRTLLTAGDLGEPVSEKDPVRKSISEIAASLAGIDTAKATKGWLSGLRTPRKKEATT